MRPFWRVAADLEVLAGELRNLRGASAAELVGLERRLWSVRQNLEATHENVSRILRRIEHLNASAA